MLRICFNCYVSVFKCYVSVLCIRFGRCVSVFIVAYPFLTVFFTLLRISSCGCGHGCGPWSLEPRATSLEPRSLEPRASSRALSLEPEHRASSPESRALQWSLHVAAWSLHSSCIWLHGACILVAYSCIGPALQRDCMWPAF